MTPDQIQQAVQFAAQGRTLREIAHELGVGDSKTVWLALRDRVPARRRGPRGRTDVPDERIVEMVDAGLSWQEIADAVGMSRSGVRARWRRAAKFSGAAY